MATKFDTETCRELERKAGRWAREAWDGRDRALARRLRAEFRALRRRQSDGRKRENLREAREGMHQA